jgi:hypothetical protein
LNRAKIESTDLRRQIANKPEIKIDLTSDSKSNKNIQQEAEK